jgi:hypothetical protein
MKKALGNVAQTPTVILKQTNKANHPDCYEHQQLTDPKYFIYFSETILSSNRPDDLPDLLTRRADRP